MIARFKILIEKDEPSEEDTRYRQSRPVIEQYVWVEYSAILRIIQGINNEAIAENSKQVPSSSSIRSSEIREN